MIDVCPFRTLAGSSSLTTCGSADREMDYNIKQLNKYQ